ncbi:prolyl oligopeptidase family protein [Opitutaceae bacterium TAV1]|nr:prolyl oligopeptidase family protein [Opitutaceae bacterium TAV1]
MPRFRRLLVSALLPVILIYTGYCLMLALVRDRLLFAQHNRARAAGHTAPAGFETWWLDLPDGEGRVEAWWSPAPDATREKPAPAVLYFHGNAQLIDDSTGAARVWNGLGVSTLLVSYRGYGRSGGKPTADNGITDAVAWFDRLAARPEVDARAILAHGYSLGGAFAAQLATRRPVAGLALESTFASIPRMAHAYGVWIYFPRERLDTVAALKKLPSGVPVLVTHGTQDRVVPFSENRPLLDARPDAIRHTGDFGHMPWAQEEPGHALLRQLLAASHTRKE